MKKKNKKFIDFWNKIKKPLMILSVVGNILFILFIILGSIGVKKNKSQIVYADDELARITDLSGTSWYMNQYVDTPIGNWLDLSPGTNLEYNIDYYWSEDYYQDDEPFYYRYNYLHFYRDSLSVSESTLSYFRSWSAYPRNIEAYKNQTSWAEDSYRYISFAFGQSYDDAKNVLLINWFYRNATLLFAPQFENSFEFVKEFNYNAPYRRDIDSIFVPQSWGENPPVGIEKVYDFPMFMSNGQLFNRIRLWYWYGYGTQYQIDSEHFITAINDDENTAHYGFMQYQNTITGDSQEINYCLTNTGNESYLSSSQVKTYLVKGSLWVNDNYRSLVFSDSLTPEQQNNLAQFNSSLFGSNGFSISDEDIGLGNVFSLLSTSFGAFTNIFRIEILPNITIGLLLFLPLIVGIIIFIIWLIKR